MKRVIVNIIIFVVISCMLTTCVFASSNNKTLISVDDNEVSLGAFTVFLRYNQAQSMDYYAQMYSMFGQEMPSELWDTSYASTEAETKQSETSSESEEESVEKLEEVVNGMLEEPTTNGEDFRRNAVKYMVQTLLLKKHMSEYDINLSDEEIEEIKKVASDYYNDNDSAMFKYDGVSEENISDFLELFTIGEKVEHAIKRSFTVDIADEDAKMSTINYAKFSPSDFETDSTVTVENMTESDIENMTEADIENMTETEMEIDTNTKAKNAAELFLDEVKKDENKDADWTTFVSNYDEKAYSTNTSFGKDENTWQIPSDIIDVVKDLSDGEIYDTVIESEGNYYVVRMDSVNDEEQTEERRKTLDEEERDKLLDNLVDSWVEGTSIDISNKLLSKVEVNDRIQFSINHVAEENDFEVTADDVTLETESEVITLETETEISSILETETE